ncbi:MAG: glycosyl transferase [Dehalococcoidia bacterium]|nr:glycosyl transferase [Dehalococcoidia bacterium]
MRVALVHDFLYVHGGAERALEEMHAIWPEAPIFTLLYVHDRLPAAFRAMDIRTTWVDRLPGRHRLQRLYALWQPLVFSTLRLRGFDLVLSSASFGAKAVAAPPGARHVCYCYTPPRFLWDYEPGIARDRLPRALRLGERPLRAALRRWDRAAAGRVDSIVAISQNVAQRIVHVYQRPATVIYPPVQTDRFRQPARAPGSYWLVVSRFEAYKRVDLAIAAANALHEDLVIVGEGGDEPRLRRLAGPTVRFLGHQSDEAVAELMARCRALLFPGEEDFGLTPLEANAAGKPVIAYGAGGALETVVPGVTGLFFTEPTVDSLVEQMTAFDSAQFDTEACWRQAGRFAPPVFRERLQAHVRRIVASHQSLPDSPSLAEGPRRGSTGGSRCVSGVRSASGGRGLT